MIRFQSGMTINITLVCKSGSFPSNRFSRVVPDGCACVATWRPLLCLITWLWGQRYALYALFTFVYTKLLFCQAAQMSMFTMWSRKDSPKESKRLVLSNGLWLVLASGWKTTRAVALRFSYGVWWVGQQPSCDLYMWCYDRATSRLGSWVGWGEAETFMSLAYIRDATLRLRFGLGLGWGGVA